MKDITRIHIAKVPYEIELTAKKELQTYIAALEVYTSDEELLEDIEVRMTELLAERGIKQNDVITRTDVKAVREQLGEPKDFMTDEATLGVNPDVLTQISGRRLYRNLDTAILGGVLGGIASYFRMNALWIRLIFIILIFGSFGTFVLLYAVLWVIVPAARTAAEKLQLDGKPVTLASIRQLNESGLGVHNAQRTRMLKRVATIILGIIGLIGAIAATGVVIMALPMNPNWGLYHSIAGVYQVAITLAEIAGVLLVALFLLIAFAAFAQKFNKQIWISGIIIIVLGLGFVGSAIITGTVMQNLQSERIQRDMTNTNVNLPVGYEAVHSLLVDIPTNSYVTYIVDDTTTSIMQRGMKDMPKVNVAVVGGTLELKLDKSDALNPVFANTMTVYGPSLDSIVVSNGSVSYNGASQPNLRVEVYNASSLILNGSRIATLVAKTDGSASLFAEQASVSAVQASVYGKSSIGLGNIKSLEVTNPDVCGLDETATLSVQGMLSATYLRNGVESLAKSNSSACWNVFFNSDSSSSTR